ncbi:DivIVA domain-containing protein [Pseudonocardia sp. EV170527-09]|uniref:DivIVA domain-containing protein n=1 Tax=Pseudonocardia sp. EV170527-09 TaxID=2603411 RepID=UPI0011F18AC1|nr:DivIVA domain-containing protein [Pseudonocardia sp. EV170527-09]KAA1029283.1 DivIVA domain-containing protein [Pseudonocardia sp. EV170527-09]
MYRVFESLDALVTIVEEARSVPMTSNCVVPRGDVLELLDDVREAIPGEMDDAQDVLDRRDDIVSEAEREAEETRTAANSEAEETLQNARTEAERLVAEAQEEAGRTLAEARHEAERAVAEGRRQYAELTDRARDEAERMSHAGRAAHDRLIADGQNEQTRLVSQTEVVRSAHAEADRLRRECDDYVDTTLGELETTLNNALGVVGRGRSQIWRGQYGPNYGGGLPPEQGRTGTGMDLID